MNRLKFVIPFILCSIIGHAQFSIELTTGFTNTLSWGQVESASDSTIRFAYYTGISNVAEHIVALTLRKTDLSALDTSVIWSRNNRVINMEGGLYFQHSKGNSFYVDVWSNDSNTVTSKVSVSYLNADKTPGTHLFTKRWSRMQIKGVPQIIGDSMYVLVTPPVISDTVFVEIYDLQGNLAKRKYFDVFMIFGASANGLYHSSEVDSLIVITTIADCGLIYLNRYTLDTAKTIPVDAVFLANHEYGYFETQATYLSKDHISQFGNVSMLFGISTGNINNDDQVFYYRRTWSGDSVYLINLGPRYIDNDAVAFWEETNSINPRFIIAGRLPSHPSLMPSLPNQVVVYRHNQFGTDSLLLFGSNNHLPRTLFGDDNGDLYMFSTYTLTNTTGETKGVLTKIPAFLIGLIEEQKVSPEIILYPNPTLDIVRFDENLNHIQKIEVYSQDGRLVRVFERPKNHEISLLDLPPQLYIVVLELKNSHRVSSLIIKK